MTAATAAPPKKPKGGKKPKQPNQPKPVFVKVDAIVHEHHLKCEALAKEIKADELEVEQLKQEYTAARNSLKEKNARLTRMTFSGPEKMPLFDPKPTEQVSTDGPKAESTDQTAKPAKVEGWSLTAIGTVLADPSFDKTVERFIENGIKTAGDFEALRARHLNGDWFSEIKGIGRAKADRVEQAVLDWIAQNR